MGVAVSRAYRDSITPLLMLAYEQDSLVGVVSLATNHQRREAFFLASATGDYCDFLSSPASRLEFVDLALDELRKLKMPALVAASLPANSVTACALTAATLHGYKTFSRPASLCAQIILGSSAERQNLKDSVAKSQGLSLFPERFGKARTRDCSPSKVARRPELGAS